MHVLIEEIVEKPEPKNQTCTLLAGCNCQKCEDRKEELRMMREYERYQELESELFRAERSDYGGI